jgi:hypothetical protein
VLVASPGPKLKGQVSGPGRASPPPSISPSSPFPDAPSPVSPLGSYRVIIVGGHIDWSPQWIQRLRDYVKGGGIIVINASQIKGLPADLIGVHLSTEFAETDSARCLSGGEDPQDLHGQMFRYQRIEARGAKVLIQTPEGDPLVTVNKIGKGSVVFCGLPDLLGEDERITPFAAHMLADVFVDATPIKVEGDVEYLINRNDTGWVVTLFNNDGVFKPQQGLAQVDRSAVKTVTISLAAQQIQSANEWISDKSLEIKKQDGREKVSLTIAPGAVAVVELSLPR